MKNNLVIVGCGNILMSDDGIGVHLATLLREKLPKLQIYDAGVSLFTILSTLNPNEIATLIIIDAMDIKKSRPGKMYKFDLSQFKPLPDNIISLHDANVINDWISLRLLGYKFKRTTVFGIVPETVQLGNDLSPTLKSRIPKYISEIIKEIKLN